MVVYHVKTQGGLSDVPSIYRSSANEERGSRREEGTDEEE